MADNKETTHIRVTVEVKDMLAELGKKNETYDDIIRRLLKVK